MFVRGELSGSANFRAAIEKSKVLVYKTHMHFIPRAISKEVDFLFPGPGGRLWMAECKAAKTVQPAMAGPLLSLRRSMSRPPARLLLVHRRPEAVPATHALSPGVAAVDVRELLNLLAGGQ